MPRPCKKRRVTCNPLATSFEPNGVSGHKPESIALSYDELEAIRLADYEGMYQERAAKKMNISRQTFGNIIAAAHKKVADFLVNSKRLLVEGGMIDIAACRFVCETCRHTWSVPHGSEKPKECPQCRGNEFYCSKKTGKEKKALTCWRKG